MFTVTDQPEEDAHELVTVVLSELGDGRTEMTSSSGYTCLPSTTSATAQGWSTFFDRIDERLA